MPGSSNFLVFNPTNTLNTDSDGEYLAEIQRIGGLQDGIAKTAMHNKFYRQVSIMVAALAQFMADAGQAVSDNDLAALISVIHDSIETPAGAQGKADAVQDNVDVHAGESASETAKGHVELATLEETISGTDSTLAVHPAGLKALTTSLVAISRTLLWDLPQISRLTYPDEALAVTNGVGNWFTMMDKNMVKEKGMTKLRIIMSANCMYATNPESSVFYGFASNKRIYINGVLKIETLSAIDSIFDITDIPDGATLNLKVDAQPTIQSYTYAQSKIDVTTNEIFDIM